VTLFGRDVTRLPEPRRASLGLARTYQITNLFPGLTALENVLLAVQGTTWQKWILHRPVTAFRESLDRAAQELDRVGLAPRAGEAVQRLSYGERRQLEFALALASRPRAILLDEPAAGLSPADRDRIAKTIAQVPRDITVLLIEHNMDVVLGLADRITVLHQGCIITEGTPDEVRANPQAREVYLGTA
jgi:branched-chain amino acid transport system ATP-binding protein